MAMVNDNPCHGRHLDRTVCTHKQFALYSQENKNSHGTFETLLKFSLRGHHGPQKVWLVHHGNLYTQGKAFHLKQHFTCTNFVIYVAQCRLCSNFFVGQTKNQFNKNIKNRLIARWNGHCSSYKKWIKLLSSHFYYQRNKSLSNNPKLDECNEVIFLREPELHNLRFL